ncbi:MAG: sec-independent protein translocase protein TatA [Mycobacterium sp.]|nr:sec-independent protein translocase protein TatA [Mycobacterium sp.]
MFANFGPGHWAVLAIVMIVLFGAKKLPGAARSLGKSMRIFKAELGELQNESELKNLDAAPNPGRSERVDVPAPRPGRTQTQTDAGCASID